MRSNASQRSCEKSSADTARAPRDKLHQVEETALARLAVRQCMEFADHVAPPLIWAILATAAHRLGRFDRAAVACRNALCEPCLDFRSQPTNAILAELDLPRCAPVALEPPPLDAA